METLSYGIWAVSLGVRLAANISAGHLLFVILSGFAFKLGLFSGLNSIISDGVHYFIGDDGGGDSS